MGPVIVALLRIFLPLSILKWPLAGGLLAWVLDAIDVEIINTLGFWDDFKFKNLDYQVLDKYLDMFYLSLELYVVLSWKNLLVKRTAIALYVYRLIGFVLFEIRDQRYFLFLFPNLFEYFYVFYLAHKRILKKDILTNYRIIALVVLGLLIPKLVQEYIANVKEFPIWSSIKQSVGIEVINP